MEFSEAEILAWFVGVAQQPALVYGAVIGFMVASSFGFPVPEEVVLIGSGMVGYAAIHQGGSEGVDVQVLAAVCFLAVFLSDFRHPTSPYLLPPTYHLPMAITFSYHQSPSCQ